MNKNEMPADQNVSENCVLKLINVTKRFDHLVAVKSISLSIRPHEIVGLVGENGAGKSTLLKILAGVHTPDEGTIEIHGKVTQLKNPVDSASQGIGVVHQGQSLFTNMTVGENIAMSAVARGTSATKFGIYRWNQINKEAKEILSRIGSQINPKTKMEDLTSANRQMVEIARALHVRTMAANDNANGKKRNKSSVKKEEEVSLRMAMLEVKIASALNADKNGNMPLVILDEPTAILERNEVEILEREIHDFKSVGSVIFVSHRLEEVLGICDRIVVMRDGQIVADVPRENVDQDKLFQLMIGHTAHKQERISAKDTPVGERFLTIESLTKKDKFKDINLSINLGRVTAIVGTFGSGREDLCRSIFGLESFNSGQMIIGGKIIHHWTINNAIQAGIAYLPSDRQVEGMVGGMTAAQNLTMTHPGECQKGLCINPSAQRKFSTKWFEKLDVHPRNTDLELERFSGGNQQKVVLAKWLSGSNLKLLILDHPLSGLDPGAMETVREQILEVCRSGASVILLADTLEEALELGNDIYVMRDGSITAHYDMSTEHPTTLNLLEKMV